jgi:hypothetical protein
VAGGRRVGEGAAIEPALARPNAAMLARLARHRPPPHHGTASDAVAFGGLVAEFDRPD